MIDIGGGMFGVMGSRALFERQKTGQGQTVKSALFETTAFFMGQHGLFCPHRGTDPADARSRERLVDLSSVSNSR